MTNPKHTGGASGTSWTASSGSGGCDPARPAAVAMGEFRVGPVRLGPGRHQILEEQST